MHIHLLLYDNCAINRLTMSDNGLCNTLHRYQMLSQVCDTLQQVV